jgi:Late competence development protein ComFB
LNRLPPLYASTQEGYQWQQQQARKSMKGFIYRMVKLSIKVSQRKAKVFSIPLKVSQGLIGQDLQLLSENS